MPAPDHDVCSPELYPAARRRVAEMMGWRVEDGESLVAGTIRLWNPTGECVACCGADIDLWVWNLPDFLHDGAAAWALLEWLLKQYYCLQLWAPCGPDTTFEAIIPNDVAGPVPFGEGATPAAALFAAACAWIEAREQKGTDNA